MEGRRSLLLVKRDQTVYKEEAGRYVNISRSQCFPWGEARNVSKTQSKHGFLLVSMTVVYGTKNAGFNERQSNIITEAPLMLGQFCTPAQHEYIASVY